VRWDYGTEGAIYPVQRGEVWQCGRHVWACGTLLDLDHVTADLFYCDPPWNNAITSTFRNNAGYGADAGATWQDIYHGIIRAAAGRPLFVEGGEKQADEVQAMLRDAGLPAVMAWPITYARATRPCVLHYGGPPPGIGDPSGLDDADTPAWAMGRFPAGLVADLTAGRGITSRCAEESGWSSFNIELDGRRVSAALARLSRLTRQEPMRVEPAFP
jgi:hypothetical protein